MRGLKLWRRNKKKTQIYYYVNYGALYAIIVIKVLEGNYSFKLVKSEILIFIVVQHLNTSFFSFIFFFIQHSYKLNFYNFLLT